MVDGNDSGGDTGPALAHPGRSAAHVRRPCQTRSWWPWAQRSSGTSAIEAALQRAAILSNEKYRGVRIEVSPGQLKISAHNPEQEEAEDTLVVDYTGDNLEIGFNVNYLIDVTNVLSGDTIKLTLSDSNSSVLLEESVDSDSVYVIMPMRL